MTSLLLVVAAALAPQAGEPSPTPTPVATAAINVLMSRPDSEAGPRGNSLSDVAKHIKLKLPANQPRVLTNASVKQLAEGVELTTGAGGSAQAAVAPLSNAGDESKKAKWQQRYRAALDRVRNLEATVKSLETQVAGLERDFYGRDDAVYRDSVIKPAWDKALADLQKARADLETARKQPDEVITAARRDGALPGWFRGLDETPPPAAGAAPARPSTRPTPKPRSTQPKELQVGPPT